MKRIHYVFFIVLALLLSGCSAADSDTQKEPSNVIGDSNEKILVAYSDFFDETMASFYAPVRYQGSAAVILNLALNAVLIFGMLGFPRMGIQGAALATLIARIVELALVLVENRKKDVVRIRWQCIRNSDIALRKDYIYYTSPVLANELVWGCGFTMFSVITGHLGSDAVAANSIANIVKNVISCFCLGIGTGSGIIIGNELGCGNLNQAKKYGKSSARPPLQQVYCQEEFFWSVVR